MRKMPEQRFFIDHGTIHDRATGKHVRTDPDFGPGRTFGEDGLEQCCDLLNRLHDSGDLSRVVAWMRTKFPQNRHAQEWADAIEKREWDQIAAEHRERERVETVHCPHCGTPGVWTYGGLEPAWLGNGNAKLSEFSETIRWDGTHEMGRDHSPEVCLAKCLGEATRIVDGLVESRVLDRQMVSDLAAARRAMAAAMRVPPPEWARTPKVDAPEDDDR
jgi:hypothetical protein